MIEQMRIDEVTGDLKEAMEAFGKVYISALEASFSDENILEIQESFLSCIRGLPVSLRWSLKNHLDKAENLK